MQTDKQEHFNDGKYLTRHAKELLFGIAIVFGFLVMISGTTPQHIVGWQKTPGSFFEKRVYSTRLFVLVSLPKSDKIKKLPADIRRETGGCNDDGDSCSNSLYYFLDDIRVGNEVADTFDLCILKLNQFTDCTDNADGSSTTETTYKIQLTSEVVK